MKHSTINIKIYLLFCTLAIASIGFTGCEKENIYQYEINDFTVDGAYANKVKLKTPEQYVAILHINLYNTPMSANDIYRLSRVYLSIGDKEVAQEAVVSNFMNDDDARSYAFDKGYEVIKPTNAEMRSNFISFLHDAFERFYLRPPTEAEIEWFKQYITAHENITPEMVFFSFAISNEYQYY